MGLWQSWARLVPTTRAWHCFSALSRRLGWTEPENYKRVVPSSCSLVKNSIMCGGLRLAADAPVMSCSSSRGGGSSGWSWVKSLFSAPATSQQPPAGARRAPSFENLEQIQQQQQHLINWQFQKPEMISVQGMNIMHYTSLRDIMLLQWNEQHQVVLASPRTRRQMKNRLVEQAARAYLHPSSRSVDNGANQFFPWNWQKLMSSRPLTFTFGSNHPSSTAVVRSSTGNMGFFSRALRYLLGRIRSQPIRLL